MRYTTLLGVFLFWSWCHLGAAPLRIAWIGIETDEAETASAKVALELKSLVQAELNSSDWEWVERADIDHILGELRLNLDGHLNAREALLTGRLLHADLLVRGNLILKHEFGLINLRLMSPPQLTLEVIDLRHADSIAKLAFELAPQKSRVFTLLQDDIGTTKAAVARVIQQGLDELATWAGKPVVAPLFFKNIGQFERLNYVEARLIENLAKASHANGGARVLHFDRNLEAAAEGELSVLGLASSDDNAWRQVADLYVSGTFAELPGGNGEFERQPVEILLTLWDGVNPPIQLRWNGPTAEIEEGVVSLSAEVLKKACIRPLPAGQDNNLAPEIAATLRRRAAEIATRLDGPAKNEFAKSSTGKQLHAYLIRLLETACFFDPANAALARERVLQTWPRDMPAAYKRADLYWRAFRDFKAHTGRFPFITENRADTELHERQAELLETLIPEELAEWSTSFPRNMQLCLETWKDEVLQFNQATGVDTKSLRDFNEKRFRALFLSERWRTNSSIGAIPLYQTIEAVWPKLKGTYLGWRDAVAAGDTVHAKEIDEAAVQMLSVYDALGLTERAIHLLSEENVQSPNVRGPEFANVHPDPAPLPNSETIYSLTPVAGGFRDIPPLSFAMLDDPLPLQENRAGVIRMYASPKATPQLLHHDGANLWINIPPVENDPALANIPQRTTSLFYSVEQRQIVPLPVVFKTIATLAAVQTTADAEWFGFANEGVWRIGPRLADVRKFEGKNGLPSQEIGQLTKSEDGIIVVGGNTKPFLGLIDFESEKWTDLPLPGTSEDAKTRHYAGCRHSLVTVQDDVLLLDLKTKKWETISSGAMPARGFNCVESDESGFWLGGQNGIAFLDVATGKIVTSHTLAEVTALASEGQYLWVLATIDKTSQVLALFDKDKKVWAGALRLKHGGNAPVVSLAATPGRAWLFAEHIYALDVIQPRRSLHSLGAKSPPWLAETLGRKPPPGDARPAGKKIAEGINSAAGDGTDFNALYTAAEDGRADSVRTILATGLSPDQVTLDGLTPLAVAAAHGHLQTVEAFLSAGANPDGMPTDGYTAVFFGPTINENPDLGLQADKTPGLPRLLSARTLKDGRVALSWNPPPGPVSRYLLTFTDSGRVQSEREAHQSIKLPAGTRMVLAPKLLASDGARTYTVRAVNAASTNDYRLDKIPGASVAVTTDNGSGDAPLDADYRAAGSFQKFRDRRSAQSNRQQNPVQPNSPPLLMAIQTGHGVVAEKLLELGAGANSSNANGWSAMHEAARSADPTLFAKLLDHGGNPYRKDANQRTPLEILYHREPDHRHFYEILAKYSQQIPYLPAELLVEEARAGREEAVDRLLKSGADLSTPTSAGDTAIGAALDAGRGQLARRLFARGFDSLRPCWIDDYPHKAGGRLLFQAMAAHDYLLVNALAVAGYDPYMSIENRNALEEAVHNDDVEAARILYEHTKPEARAVFDPRNPETKDKLHSIAMRRIFGVEDAMAFPTDRHVFLPVARPISTGNYRTPSQATLDAQLIAATKNGDLAQVRSLLEKDTWIECRTKDTQQTPLVIAIAGKYWDVARELIEAGADLNVVTLFGSSPLCFAVERADLEFVRFMLNRGANPNLFANKAAAPLDFGIHRGPEMMRLLFEYGAFPNIVSRSLDREIQFTPLIRACLDGRIEEASVLLQNGADPNAGPCNDLKTYYFDGDKEARIEPEAFASPSLIYNAAFWAASSNQVELLKQLKQAGCRIGHINRGGYNPLDWALQENATQAIDYLRAEGLRSRAERNPSSSP